MESMEFAFSMFLFSITFAVVCYIAGNLYSFIIGLKIKKLKEQNVMTRLMNGDPTVKVEELPNFALPKTQIDFWKYKYYDLVNYNKQALLEKNEVIILQNIKIKSLIADINNLKNDPYHIETETKQFKKKNRIK